MSFYIWRTPDRPPSQREAMASLVIPGNRGGPAQGPSTGANSGARLLASSLIGHSHVPSHPYQQMPPPTQHAPYHQTYGQQNAQQSWAPPVRHSLSLTRPIYWSLC